jgi:hypothetical protein
MKLIKHSAYGRLIYRPDDDLAVAATALTGTKTLTQAHVDALRALGVAVEIRSSVEIKRELLQDNQKLFRELFWHEQNDGARWYDVDQWVFDGMTVEEARALVSENGGDL